MKAPIEVTDAKSETCSEEAVSFPVAVFVEKSERTCSGVDESSSEVRERSRSRVHGREFTQALYNGKEKRSDDTVREE